jgi:hypothetical protein
MTLQHPAKCMVQGLIDIVTDVLTSLASGPSRHDCHIHLAISATAQVYIVLPLYPDHV